MIYGTRPLQMKWRVLLAALSPTPYFCFTNGSFVILCAVLVYMQECIWLCWLLIFVVTCTLLLRRSKLSLPTITEDPTTITTTTTTGSRGERTVHVPA